MKKILFVAVALVALCSFNSCQKACTCTEEYTGYSQKMNTNSAYPTCKDIEKTFVLVGAEDLGQEWTCR